MISEELKNYLIEQFKKQETELLLTVIESKHTARYLVQASMTDVGGMIAVKFDREQNRFIELSTEVIKPSGKIKLETIEL